MARHFKATAVKGNVVFFALHWVPDMNAGGMRQEYTPFMRVNRVELDPGGMMYQIKDDIYTSTEDIVPQVSMRILSVLPDTDTDKEVSLSLQDSGEEIKIRRANIQGSKGVVSKGLMVGSKVFSDVKAAAEEIASIIREFWDTLDEQAKEEAKDAEEVSESVV